MFYLKTLVDGKPQNVDIYDEEIFTTCFQCGTEIPVESETLLNILKDGWDLASTSISCGCNTERPRLVRIK